MHINRSKMATGRKCPPQYTFDVHFTSEEEKDTFTTRLKSICQLLTPEACRSIENYSLFNALFAAVEGASHLTSDSEPSTRSFMSNKGMFNCSKTCLAMRLVY